MKTKTKVFGGWGVGKDCATSRFRGLFHELLKSRDGPRAARDNRNYLFLHFAATVVAQHGASPRVLVVAAGESSSGEHVGINGGGGRER